MGIQLHMSTSTSCNARCKFCIYASEENSKEPRIFMKWDLYEKIIREAATIPQIDQIAFSGLQEPLTDKLLEKRIALVTELRPDWMIELYTNGVFLTSGRFDSLKAAGLNCLTVSINAVRQEQHERIMGLKGKYTLVCDNARYARDNRGTMRMLTKAVVSNDDFTISDAALFLSLWGDNMQREDGIGRVVYEMNWAGENRLIDGRVLDPDSTCNRALEQISIHPDGRVGLCCLDPLVKHQMGDLNKQTLIEIYNAAGYVEFRQWHIDKQASKHPLCAKCTRV